MKLESFEGLGIIPIDILQLGSKKIVEYLLDLFRSPSGDPLFRSKLMVVGYESVGKTTILDCLFPLEGYLIQQGKLVKTKYWFRLQGNTLRKYERRGDAAAHKDKVIVFENRQWEVTSLPKDFRIKISPRSQSPQQQQQQPKGGGEEKEITLYCGDRETQEVWLGRLRRVCMNEATHGIEIQSHSLDNDITRVSGNRFLRERRLARMQRLMCPCGTLRVSRTITTITTTSSRPEPCFLCCGR